MKKYFVSYNQAVALKGLGFDGSCFGYYNLGDTQIYFDTIIDRQHNKFRNNTDLNFYGDLVEKIAIPLKAQVFEWFREKHNLASFIWYNSLCEKWRFDEIICLKTGDTLVDSGDQFKTYGEAELDAIDKLIELLK